MTEAFFGAYPYLCMSVEMLVTPGTVKSKSGTGYPILRIMDRCKPPTQAST